MISIAFELSKTQLYGMTWQDELILHGKRRLKVSVLNRHNLYFQSNTNFLIDAAADSALLTPTLLSSWITCRCKLDTSTSSWSTTPMRPTPAPPRYRHIGEPRPPAPTTNMEVFRSLSWPLIPTSGRMSWRPNRLISAFGKWSMGNGQFRSSARVCSSKWFFRSSSSILRFSLSFSSCRDMWFAFPTIFFSSFLCSHYFLTYHARP